MNNNQLSLINELAEHKSSFLELTGEISEIKGKELDRLYKEFSPLYVQYFKNLRNEVGSRIVYLGALESKKINPYVAGGIAQGLAGVGAGIYTTVSTSQRNNQIDRNRADYSKQVIRDSVATKSSEEKLLDITSEINALLNTMEEIIEYRKKIIADKYTKAIDLIEKANDYQSIEDAKRIFSSMRDYEDSLSYIDKCDRKWLRIKKAEWRKIIWGLGVVIAFLVAAMNGDVIGGFPLSLLITAIIFVPATEIYIYKEYYKYKNNKFING